MEFPKKSGADKLNKMIDVPIWAAILVSILSLLLLYIFFKSIGVRLAFSIGLSFIFTCILLIILHPFDITNGILTAHSGDTYTSIFIILSILYNVILGLHVVFRKPFMKRCCGYESDNLNKIISAYDDTKSWEEHNPIIANNSVDTEEGNYDRRQMGGMIISESEPEPEQSEKQPDESDRIYDDGSEDVTNLRQQAEGIIK